MWGETGCDHAPVVLIHLRFIQTRLKSGLKSDLINKRLERTNMARKLPWNAQPKAKPPSKIRTEDSEPTKSPTDSPSTDDDLNRVNTHHGAEQSNIDSSLP